MWDPVKLVLHNFFSHEHTEFKFRIGEMILLLGQIDGDDPGADSNGAGKSAIIEGITVAITGANSQGLNKEAMVRDGQKSCSVGLHLLHSVSKETFTIIRTIFPGNKSTILEILENDCVVNFDKMQRTAQQYIYEKLGITEEDFLNHYVINQGNESSFLTSTDSKQKEVISRFSNYSKIEPIIAKIAEELAENDAQTAKLRAEHINCNATIAQLDETIEDLKSDAEFENRRTAILADISQKELVLKSLQQKRADVRQLKIEAHKVHDKLNNLKGNKETVTKLEAKLSKIRKEKNKAEEELNEALEIKTQLAIRSGSVIQCPNCKLEFIPNDDMTPEAVEVSKGVVKQELNRIEGLLEQYKEQIDKCRMDIKNAEHYDRSQKVVQEYTDRFNSLTTRWTECEESLKQLKDDLAALKHTTNAKLIQATEAKREQQVARHAELDIQLQALAAVWEDLKFQKFSFDKQFRTYIANKTIRTIQDKLNIYLKKFKIGFQILINGYTLLKSGEVREKIQIFALTNAVQRLIKALSGGQRGRAALCGVIAVHKLINEASPSGGLNLLCFDEFLAALDATGQNNVIKILEQSGITSIVVMHYAADTEAKNKVVVHYKDEISRIKQ